MFPLSNPLPAGTSTKVVSVLKRAPKACLLLLTLIFMSPDVRSAETPAFNYRPVEQADLERVRTEWASRDLRARAVEVFHEEDKEGFKLLLLRHEVLGRTHYGAIFLPEIDDLAKAPVVVLPDGLDQGNPAFDIETEISKYQVHGQQLLYPLKVLYPLDAGLANLSAGGDERTLTTVSQGPPPPPPTSGGGDGGGGAGGPLLLILLGGLRCAKRSGWRRTTTAVLITIYWRVKIGASLSRVLGAE